jgi:DNA-binding XRE family transcriptional regulator
MPRPPLSLAGDRATAVVVVDRAMRRARVCAEMPTPDQPVDQALPVVLRQLREARGLSQEATAQAAGIALNTYSRIERGQTSPAWPTVRALAAALDVSMAKLGAAVDAQR